MNFCLRLVVFLFDFFCNFIIFLGFVKVMNKIIINDSNFFFLIFMVIGILLFGIF